MPRKVVPTGKQKSAFLIHLVIYIIGFAAMWLTYDKGVEGWAYPWPAWITAAWGLALIGHWCAVYRSYEDRGQVEYERQAKN
jgi:hypothetical protein